MFRNKASVSIASICAHVIALFGSEGFDSCSTFNTKYLGAYSFLTEYRIFTVVALKSFVFWSIYNIA
jgi:hypothetical protein